MDLGGFEFRPQTIHLAPPKRHFFTTKKKNEDAKDTKLSVRIVNV